VKTPGDPIFNLFVPSRIDLRAGTKDRSLGHHDLVTTRHEVEALGAGRAMVPKKNYLPFDTGPAPTEKSGDIEFS